jgi:lipopolysaccharide transport system ATP-binding protein
MVGLPLLKCSQGSRRIGTYTTKLPLMDGNYVIEVQLTKPIIFDETVEFLDVIENAVVFSVARRPISRVWSKVYIDNEFTLTVI